MLDTAPSPFTSAFVSHGSDGVRPAPNWSASAASTLVVVYHLLRIPMRSIPDLSAVDELWLRTAGLGWTGVNLFFILSGFLITGILYESKGPALAYFRNFYARRVLRIVPAYFAFLIFLFFVLPFLLPSESDKIAFVRDQQMWFWTYLANIQWYLKPASIFGPTYFYGHLWSLMVEEQFYLVWPVFVLLFSRSWLVVVTVCVIATAFVLRIVLLETGGFPLLVYSFTPARMDDLAIGALIALLVRGPETRRLLAAVALPIAGAALAGLAVVVAVRGGLPALDPWVLKAGLPLIGLFYGGLFAALILSPAASIGRTICSQSHLRWMGKYSYALYIIHLPVVNTILRHTGLGSSIPEVFGSYIPRTLVVAAVALVITLVLTLASWRLIESPFLRLRSRFPQKNATLSLQRV